MIDAAAYGYEGYWCRCWRRCGCSGGCVCRSGSGRGRVRRCGSWRGGGTRSRRVRRRGSWHRRWADCWSGRDSWGECRGWSGCDGRGGGWGASVYDWASAERGQPVFELADGNCKSDVVHGPAAVGFLDPGRVDADHLAVSVDERTPTVARVYRRIGLQQLDAGHHSGGGDDPTGHSQVCTDPVSKREAQREHLVADAHAVRVANPDCIKGPSAIYLHQRKVGSRVSLQHVAVIAASIGQPDNHAARAIYHMLVGYDQPVLVDNEAGPAAAAYDNLHHACLDTFDDIGERRFALVGQIGATNELDIDHGSVRRRGCARGEWRRCARVRWRWCTRVRRRRGLSGPDRIVTASRGNHQQRRSRYDNACDYLRSFQFRALLCSKLVRHRGSTL